MQLEHHVRDKSRPGLEVAYSIIPEDMKMNPNCPCKTRTCPHHGFCKMCVRHHNYIRDCAALDGRPGHGSVCERNREARVLAKKGGADHEAK